MRRLSIGFLVAPAARPGGEGDEDPRNGDDALAELREDLRAVEARLFDALFLLGAT